MTHRRLAAFALILTAGCSVHRDVVHRMEKQYCNASAGEAIDESFLREIEQEGEAARLALLGVANRNFIDENTRCAQRYLCALEDDRVVSGLLGPLTRDFYATPSEGKRQIFAIQCLAYFGCAYSDIIVPFTSSPNDDVAAAATRALAVAGDPP